MTDAERAVLNARFFDLLEVGGPLVQSAADAINDFTRAKMGLPKLEDDIFSIAEKLSKEAD
jgi:hypothetical protein